MLWHRGAEMRATWHSRWHGWPIVRASSTRRYCLEYICPCGAMVGQSYYPPKARLERSLRAQARLGGRFGYERAEKETVR